MIDGETGERTIHTLVKTQDEVRENTRRCFHIFHSIMSLNFKFVAFIEAYDHALDLHILQSCCRDVHMMLTLQNRQTEIAIYFQCNILSIIQKSIDILIYFYHYN